MGQEDAAEGTWTGRGLPLSHQGYFAEVVDAPVNARGEVTVHKVWGGWRRWLADHQPEWCGESGTGACIDGVSAALGQEITIDNGRAVAGELTRIRCCACSGRSRWRCTFGRQRTRRRAWVEPALPPVIPALCNAIFAATGKRIRSLPIGTSRRRHPVFGRLSRRPERTKDTEAATTKEGLGRTAPSAEPPRFAVSVSL